MPVRNHLSDEAEQEERAGSDRLREIDSRLRDLDRRRDQLLKQLQAVSETQRTLFESRGPRQDQLEATHQEHRELGHRLSELRAARDAARVALDAAVVEARLARQAVPRDVALRPESLRREMQELELKQQTRALPLSEENALIGRLRQLRRQLEEAERNHAAVEARHQAAREKEAAVQAIRARLATIAADFDAARRGREERMASMRSQLVDVGTVMAQIRERSRERSEVMARLSEVMTEGRTLETEARQLLAQSRARRQEARRTVESFRPAARGAGRASADEHAEAALEELLKRGRVSLGG
ncbi:MAG TPA: hypothetical protein VMH78_02475 [Thermoplasmata archaeon]|nr:hypothetical protein [Thermoplasmata archaeon]